MSVEEWYDTTCMKCGCYRCNDYVCDECHGKIVTKLVTEIIRLKGKVAEMKKK